MLLYKNRETSWKKRQSNNNRQHNRLHFCMHSYCNPSQAVRKDILSEALVSRICCMQLLFYLALMFHTTF